MESRPDVEAAPVDAVVITNCDGDGCGECDVCRYLEFLDWAQGCAPPESSIQRNPVIEALISL